MIKLAASFASMVVLTGCMTVTGIPREENVVYNDAGTEASNALNNSVSVGNQ